MFNLESPEVLFAIDAVHKTARLAQKIRNETGESAISKEDRSPVTVADFAIQAIVAHFLLHKFQNDPLVAEEDSDVLMKQGDETVVSGIIQYVQTFIPEADSTQIFDLINRGKAEPTNRFWTLDPIDGTKGFVRGQQYAVGLALIIDGIVQIGVIGCPNLVEAKREEMGGPGTLVLAVKGCGAWWTPLNYPRDWAELHVSGRTKLEDARMLRSREEGHTNSQKTDNLVQTAGIRHSPILMDSFAKSVMIASGKADILIRFLPKSDPEYAEKIWDQAAPVLMTEEAGGKVTDLDGKPLDFSAGKTLARNRGAVATNGKYHEEILNIVKEK